MAIHQLSALQLSAAIHRREFSCHEVMQAFLQRIAAVNPQANAIVNLQDTGQLLKQAEACDAELPQHVAELARLMETMARHAARRRGVVGNRLGL